MRTMVHDVAVVGGGMIGTALAVALARVGARVVLVERTAPSSLNDAAFDGRATAVALRAKRLLDGMGAWDGLAERAGPILDIRVSDGASRLFLHYDHRTVGSEPFGWIVENARLRRALWDVAVGTDGVTAITGVGLAATTLSPDRVDLALSDGSTVTGRLVAACDGRESPLRQSAGITTTADRYDQTALVFAVRHDEPHRGVAHERFLPTGPFAVLPLADPHRSSIVWTERDRLAHRLMALDDRRLAAEMLARFGDSLGVITPEGKRWRWPLAVHLASRFDGPRLALVGDAAHGIHPIAGQGLNLGLRDVEGLADAVQGALRLGLDPGAADVLTGYDRARRGDVLSLVAATDGLNRLFSNDAAPVRVARRLGLGAVERLPGLKAMFMRRAMGLPLSG